MIKMELKGDKKRGGGFIADLVGVLVTGFLRALDNLGQ